MERRASFVDAMLLGTVLLWSLNTTVTRYLVTNGFRPLAFATSRYFAATVLFWAFTWHRERSFRIRRADLRLVGLAAALIFLNQVCFVESVHDTTASTVGLMFGATPVFVGVTAWLVRFERLRPGFWPAAALAFAGVVLVALGGGGGVSGDLGGDLLALAAVGTWAGYSIAIAPLMRRYSPFRISAVVLAIGWVPLALVSIPQLSAERISGFDTKVWLGLGYAVVGPLFLTNILWFTAINRGGVARATLFANLQPFFTVLFAIVLLSEHLTWLEVLGAAAIGAAIIVERARGSGTPVMAHEAVSGEASP